MFNKAHDGVIYVDDDSKTKIADGKTKQKVSEFDSYTFQPVDGGPPINIYCLPLPNVEKLSMSLFRLKHKRIQIDVQQSSTCFSDSESEELAKKTLSDIDDKVEPKKFLGSLSNAPQKNSIDNPSEEYGGYKIYKVIIGENLIKCLCILLFLLTGTTLLCLDAFGKINTTLGLSIGIPSVCLSILLMRLFHFRYYGHFNIEKLDHNEIQNNSPNYQLML